MARPIRRLHLSGNPEADALLTKDPLALLIGMVLDQQIPLEWAFAGPLELQRRLDRPLDAATLAAMDPEELVAAFAGRPALHRYPGSMAERVRQLCVRIVDDYEGEPDRIWSTAPDGSTLVRRIKNLPGFGDQKARIFVALLGKQLGVRPEGWKEATAPFGEPDSFLSVADIVDAESLARVRAFKQERKAAAKAAAAAEAAPAARGAKSASGGAGKGTARKSSAPAGSGGSRTRR